MGEIISVALQQVPALTVLCVFIGYTMKMFMPILMGLQTTIQENTKILGRVLEKLDGLEEVEVE